MLDFGLALAMFIVTGIFTVLVALWLGFTLLRRALRLVVRLMMAGVMVLLLIIGALALWWGFSAKSAPTKTAPPTQRRAPRAQAR